MQPWVLNELSITGPWGTAIANATSLRGGFAPGYNQLSVVLYDCPVSHLYLRNQLVTVMLTAGGATRVLFVGYVRAAKRMVGGADENVVYCEVDGGECSADRDYCGSIRTADPLGWLAIFNEGGRPNCAAASAEFSRGQDARFWTGALALKKIRNAWLGRATWTLTDTQIDALSALGQQLKPFDVRGVRPLAAMAEVLKRCGCRMAFRYGTATPVPVLFDADGYGSFEVLWKPSAQATPPPATDLLLNEIYEIACGYDARKTLAVLDARSGLKAIETTYSTADSVPLLAGAASSDKKFLWEYRVLTANYADASHGLGPALAANARPWPIQPDLVTRAQLMAGLLYHTAEEVTADPEIGKPVACTESLAIKIGAAWKRIVGGAKLDLTSGSGALIRLQKSVTICGSTAGSKSSYSVPTGAAPDVRLTCATRVPETAYTTKSTYAPTADDYAAAIDGLLNLEALEPGYRLNAILPDPSASDPNTWVIYGSGALETYRSVATVLSAAIAGPYAQRGRDASQIELFLPFWPGEVDLGARLVVTPTPANSGITGREIVREYNWDLGDVEVRVTASDSFDLADESTGVRMKDLLARLTKLERAKLGNTAQ